MTDKEFKEATLSLLNIIKEKDKKIADLEKQLEETYNDYRRQRNQTAQARGHDPDRLYHD